MSSRSIPSPQSGPSSGSRNVSQAAEEIQVSKMTSAILETSYIATHTPVVFRGLGATLGKNEELCNDNLKMMHDIAEAEMSQIGKTKVAIALSSMGMP